MRLFRFSFLVIVSVIIWTAGVWAQSATASILGRVTDQQGAALPNTKIAVRNVATQVESTTETDAEGNYRVLALPIGTYVVTAEHSGFSKLVAEPRTLEINQQERMDLHLSVGARTEMVEVSGVGTDVETVNPTLGQSVTERPIVNLPLNGRNVLSLALLQPGVTEDNPDDGSTTQGFNIAGGRTDSVTYLLDGGANNDLVDNGVVFNPNPDSIAEFRILTSNYTAEYGRNGAGVISVVTKSGTNSFHGSAFDFIRNTDFDANSYFNIQAGLPRNNLKRNQFGGTFGGPILKDRLFFFTSYQGQRQVQTDVLPEQQIFTATELQGNFSQEQQYNGGPDPNVVSFLQQNPYFQSNASLAAQGIIDPTKFDPAAQAYITATFPNGQPLIPSNASGEFFPSGGSTDNANELTVKIDFNIDSKDRLTGTLGGNRNPILSPFGGFSTDTVPGFASTTEDKTDFLNIAYTRTFSSEMLNEVRGTAQRHSNLQDKPVTNYSAIPQFGIASDISTGPPLMTFDNGLAFGQDPYGPTTFAGNTYAVADTFSWVRGHNTWKFGAGFSAYQQNTVYAFFTNGNFGFASFNDFGDGTGNSFADFLIGAPNNLFEGPNATNNIRSKTTYVFGQDEWRATSHLTLTLGLRYEYSSPKLDTEGRTFSIIPGLQSVKFPNAPLGLVFPGDPGAPRGVNFPDKKNFAPRIGFAWSPDAAGKTSIRGGIGLFYDVLKGEDNLQFNGAPPFYSEPYVAFPCLANPADTNGCGSAPATSTLPYYSAPWANSDTPFAGNPFPSQPANSQTAFNTCANTAYTCPYYNFLPSAGGSEYFVNPHLHTPYIYQYNLSVQHEVARNIVAEANYVGSSSKGLTSLEDINPFDLSTLNSNPARILNENQNANLTAYCATQGGPSDCPFENAYEFNNISFGNFSSLEASLTKQNGENRYLGNTYFTLAYTYGHSIDNSSGFRNRDSQVPYYEPNIFRASSDFDVTHRITFSGGWDLPFDKLNGAPKRLVKGWSLYPIFSWRTGFPLSINAQLLDSFSPSEPGLSGAGDQYLANVDYAPGFSHISIENPKTNGNFYFNPAAFLCTTPGNPPTTGPCVPTSGYGTTGRDFFRGPGRTNLDLALAKTTSITERMNLELRLETFNLFNHTQFANPDTNPDDPTFGQITSNTLGSGVAAVQTQRIVQIAGRLTF